MPGDPLSEDVQRIDAARPGGWNALGRRAERTVSRLGFRNLLELAAGGLILAALAEMISWAITTNLADGGLLAYADELAFRLSIGIHDVLVLVGMVLLVMSLTVQTTRMLVPRWCVRAMHWVALLVAFVGLVAGVWITARLDGLGGGRSIAGAYLGQLVPILSTLAGCVLASALIVRPVRS